MASSNSGRKPQQPPLWKSALSPFFALGSAATMAAESFIHPAQASNPLQGVMQRFSLGYAQRNVGFGAGLYYGSKAVKSRDPADAALAAGYTAFGMEGYSRFLQSQTVHPRATPLFGVAADMLKMVGSGPGPSALGYLMGAGANWAEYSHAAHARHAGGHDVHGQAPHAPSHSATGFRQLLPSRWDHPTITRNQKVAAFMLAVGGAKKLYDMATERRKTVSGHE